MLGGGPKLEMKKLVLSLKRREDRRELFEHNNPDLEVIYVYGIDGQEITYEQLLQSGWNVDTSYIEPFIDRKLQKGNIGCSLSHWQAWNIVAQSDEPFIIMEDDCVTTDRYNEEEIRETLNECDFLYLQRNENEPTKITAVNDVFQKPYYPYNLTAYALWPETAKKLIETFGRTIIPTDEHVPLQIQKGNINAYAYNLDVCYQVARETSFSDIEKDDGSGTFRDWTGVHVCTVGTERQRLKTLNDSAIHFNIKLKNLGNNVEWLTSFTDEVTKKYDKVVLVGRGGGKKVELVRNYVQQCRDTDLIVFTDGYDSFFADDLDTILNRFLEFKTDVLFSGETHCWPNKRWVNKFPETEDPYRFLNSGGFIARVGVLKEILSHFDPEVHDDDQEFYQLQLLKNEWNMVVDTSGYLFQTNEPEMEVAENGQLYNPITNSCPLIYHGNGAYQEKEKLESLNKIIVPEAPGLYLPNYGDFNIIDKDMLLVKFMNQSQCERLIEMADDVGDWKELPDDKFPAQEIRMKQLGLWDELASHWENHLYPVIEKYWHPIEMYGLRDAFVMRYSTDTQTSLNLHHDASLVTGSVKLNEDYEGADLIFPRHNISNKEIPPGWCILFPGQVTHGHECTELTSGVKYSLTMWSQRYSGDIL